MILTTTSIIEVDSSTKSQQLPINVRNASLLAESIVGGRTWITVDTTPSLIAVDLLITFAIL